MFFLRLTERVDANCLQNLKYTLRLYLNLRIACRLTTDNVFAAEFQSSNIRLYKDFL